ncbi:MAG: ParB/RepB/Spo0J family partition protein [Gammaproteobacteria bacterium]
MSDVVSTAVEVSTATPAVLDAKPIEHLLPLTCLRPSSTKVQAERRARFNAKALQELTATIKEVNVLEPILVRPVPPEKNVRYEIVSGERRWLGAQKASLQVIPAVVRDLTDDQVLRLQLIENIQREELHGLSEIEAFEELVKRHDYTVEKLAREIGKSRAYVLQRLKLLALGEAAREAYSKGKISEDVAFMLARLPVESLQKEALKDALNTSSGEPMTARAFSRHVQQKFMLRLADASFPTQDGELVPAAGPCGTCPKRTGSQPELFKDVQGADVCTDPGCFAAKRAAWTTRQLASAKTAGRTIIEGKAAKTIAPYGKHHLEGYVRPSDRCHDDKRQRTYLELLGKSAEPAVLVVPDTGELVEVLEKKSIAPMLKERGVAARTKTSDSEREKRAKLKKESAFRWRLFEAVRGKSPSSLSRAELEQVALTTFRHHGYESRKRILKVWGWDRVNGKPVDSIHHDQVAGSRVPKLADGDLTRFLLDNALVSDLHVSAWVTSKPERLLAAAKSSASMWTQSAGPVTQARAHRRTCWRPRRRRQ